MPKTSREQKTPVRSRWQFANDERVFVVVERNPFGRLVIQQEGRAYFGYPTQRSLLASATRLPDVCPLAEQPSGGTLGAPSKEVSPC